ncbi:MAG: cytidylate kinase family protein [Candidatus Omnitrophota bacterium]
MSIVTISYGSSGIRGGLAENAAEKLGYNFAGRETLSLASQKYDIPEEKLSYALHHGPSFFGMSTAVRKRYIACIFASAAEILLRDNLVYNGPAGHVIAQGVSHILKVNLIVSLEARISFLMDRDNISMEKAEKIAAKEDADQKKWSSLFFGMDASDPNLFDRIIDVSRIGVDETVEQIAEAAREKKYQPMTYSMQCIRNKELAYRATACLIDLDPEIRAHSEEGAVFVHAKTMGRAKEKNQALIRERLEAFPDVKKIEIHMDEDLIDRMGGVLR